MCSNTGIAVTYTHTHAGTQAHVLLHIVVSCACERVQIFYSCACIRKHTCICSNVKQACIPCALIRCIIYARGVSPRTPTMYYGSGTPDIYMILSRPVKTDVGLDSCLKQSRRPLRKSVPNPTVLDVRENLFPHVLVQEGSQQGPHDPHDHRYPLLTGRTGPKAMLPGTWILLTDDGRRPNQTAGSNIHDLRTALLACWACGSIAAFPRCHLKGSAAQLRGLLMNIYVARSRDAASDGYTISCHFAPYWLVHCATSSSLSDLDVLTSLVHISP